MTKDSDAPLCEDQGRPDDYEGPDVGMHDTEIDDCDDTEPKEGAWLLSAFIELRDASAALADGPPIVGPITQRVRDAVEAANVILNATGGVATSTCGIAPLGDEPLTPTRGEAEPVAWESDVLNTISGMNQIVLSHHVVTPRRDERVRSQKPLVYASQPHAPDSWRPETVAADLRAQAEGRRRIHEQYFRKPLSCDTINNALEYGRAQGLEIAAGQLEALQPKGEER